MVPDFSVHFIRDVLCIADGKNREKENGFGGILSIASFLARYLPILLPWSLDVAMVGALYIYSGRMMRKYDVLNHIKPSYKWLLIFCTYMVVHYINGMENMSMRVYGRLLFLSVYCGIAGSCCIFWFSKAIQNTRVGGDFLVRSKLFSSILCSDTIH